MGFSKQNTGVGCHALLQGNFPIQGSEPTFRMSPALADRFFTTSTTWEAPLELIGKYIKYTAKIKCYSLSGFWLFVTPWTVAHQAPSPVHGILQVSTLEWVAISFSKGFSQPRDQTGSPALPAYPLPSEPLEKPQMHWWYSTYLSFH